MTILLTNDDGYDADGICYLKNEIKKIEQTVTFAPRQNCSGYSAAISLGKDIDVEELNKDTFVISGTPADCSYFGLHGSKKFDFTQLVSGINLGSNLGTDIFYSGTVGAAIAGLKLRYPPIAFSVASYQPKDLDFSAKKCVEICLYVRNTNIANRYLVNVNFPDIDENNYIGSKLTTLAEREKPESPIENNSDGLKFRFNASGKMKEDQLSSDIDAINNGFVSISLFDYDLTRNIDLKKINWNIDGV